MSVLEKAREAKRVELVLPMRTVLLVAAAVGVVAAFRSIGDRFLIVFIGIFLLSDIGRLKSVLAAVALAAANAGLVASAEGSSAS